MSDFVAFARACGLDIDRVQRFDHIVRVPTFNKPNKKNGAYLMRADGNGWVIAYDAGGELQWFDNPDGPKQWSKAEKLEWEKRRAKERLERERGWSRAAHQAEQMLTTTKLGTHGYLWRKGFQKEAGLVLPDGGLFIPMRNLLRDDLQGAQVVRWLADTREWEKKFLFGMNPRLAVHRLGAHNRASTTILVEGYATGLSVAAACRQMHMDCCVLVCFSDHNMVRVAEMLDNAPFKRFVFADNDDIPPAEKAKRGRGEPYEARGPGELAAVKTGLPYAMAPKYMDANDYHVSAGILALCGIVMRLLRPT